MSTLQNKIDFAAIVAVKRANPNGDPLNGNRPRTDYAGFGEITDVCIKRKLRDRLGEAGHAIFVQSDDRKTDDATSLRDRAISPVHGLGAAAFTFKKPKAKSKKGTAVSTSDESTVALGELAKREETARLACARWFDVRAFGQLFAFAPPKSNGNKDGAVETDGVTDGSGNGVSIPIRGPVTIQSAFSIEPVDVTSTQITKSVSGEGDGTKRGSDTMGMKHRVDHGIYVFFGSMNPQLAERTGFSDADAGAIKTALPRLFENDASSARPEGSMEILKLLWWQHNSKAGQFSSAKVHGTVKVNPDGSYTLRSLDGLTPEEIDGF